jgi:type II secretion system protein N
MIGKKPFNYGVERSRGKRKVGKRSLKVSLGIIVVLVIILGLVATLIPISPKVLAKFGISLDKVLAKAESRLSRRVTIEDFRFYLLRGGTFENVEIANRKGFSLSPFFKTDKIVIKYALLPLLHKELVVKKVVLVKPQILIERDKEGKWNFSDLLERRDSALPTGVVPPGISYQPQGFLNTKRTRYYMGSQAYAAPEAERSETLAIMVESVLLEKGRLIFNDECISRIIAVEDIHMLVSNISQTQKADFDVSLNIPDAMASPLKIKASFNPFILMSRPEVSARIEVDDLDLVYFTPYYKAFLPGKLQKSKLDVGVDVGLKGEEGISVKGVVGLNDFVFLPFIGMPAPIRLEKVTVEQDLQIDLEKSNLNIENMDLNLDGLSLNVKGKISDFTKDRIFDLSLSSSQLPLKKAKALASSLGRQSLLQEIAPAGTVDLKALLKGKLKELKISGILTLNDNTIQHIRFNQPLTQIRSRIEFSRDDVDISGFSANLGSSRLNLKGRIINLRRPELDCLLTSDRLVLGEVANIIAAPEDKKSVAIEGIASLTTKATGPLEELGLAGEINTSRLKLDKLEVSDANLNYTFRLPKRLLTLKSLNARLYRGKLNARGALDLSDAERLGYSLQANIEGLDLNEFLSAISEAKDKFYGTLRLDLEITGKGTDRTSLEQARGKGYLVLTEGKITDVAIQKEIAKFLLGVLQIPEFKEIHYDSLSGHFNLAGGQVIINDFLLDSPEMKVLASGSYFLDGRLDFAVTAKPTAKLIKDSNVPPHLRDERGNAVIPFKVTGTIQKPKFIPKWEKMVERAIKTEIEKQLERTVGKEETEAIKGLMEGISDIFKEKKEEGNEEVN